MVTDVPSSAAAPKARAAARPRPDWLRIGVHLVGIWGLIYLGLLTARGELTVNPIQYIEQYLGRIAIYLLVLSLAVTPIVTLTGWRALPRHRRALGLYAFFYGLLHVLVFTVVDYGLDWREIFRLTVEKPYIWVGLLAGLILIALAVTSFKYWMKHLGKGWAYLHKAVYLAGGLAVLHYAWAVKGSLSSLRGDILRPVGIGLLVALLLILRIPPVRHWAASLRYRWRRLRNPALVK